MSGHAEAVRRFVSRIWQPWIAWAYGASFDRQTESHIPEAGLESSRAITLTILNDRHPDEIAPDRRASASDGVIDRGSSIALRRSSVHTSIATDRSAGLAKVATLAHTLRAVRHRADTQRAMAHEKYGDEFGCMSRSKLAPYAHAITAAKSRDKAPNGSAWPDITPIGGSGTRPTTRPSSRSAGTCRSLGKTQNKKVATAASMSRTEIKSGNVIW